MLSIMKVLLIEDELAITRMIERGVRPHGYDTIMAASGGDPVGRTALDEVDLVLLAIQLPGKGGSGVRRDIRRIRSEFPVIMLTALDALQSKVSALDGG